MRIVCGTNLKGLGNAQVVYANDYDGQYAVQGRGIGHTWGEYTEGWQDAPDHWTQPRQITVGASLYLLVRLADVSPKSFVCPESDQVEFSGRNPGGLDIVDLWDFGQAAAGLRSGWDAEGPAQCVSYAYHQPYDPADPNATGRAGRYRADDQRSAAFAMMADRSPYYDPKLAFTGLGTVPSRPERWVSPLANHWEQAEAAATDPALRSQVKLANSQPHEREGQNVLYADGHVTFEKTPDVGVKGDNIYTRNDTAAAGWQDHPAARRRGIPIERPDRSGEDETPASVGDSLLVNDFVGRVR